MLHIVHRWKSFAFVMRMKNLICTKNQSQIIHRSVPHTTRGSIQVLTHTVRLATDLIGDFSFSNSNIVLYHLAALTVRVISNSDIGYDVSTSRARFSFNPLATACKCIGETLYSFPERQFALESRRPNR